MKKHLRLAVDRESWSNVPPQYRKACPFSMGQRQAQVDFLGALLWTGRTSVSVDLPNWWLASKWAVIRYVAAADHMTQALRLNSAAKGLDFHNKAVLSDDWGVGIALQWLAARFNYKYVAHGEFAMKGLQAKQLATAVMRKKRGPFKCPDFFAVDYQNKIHLIECKGNQQGPDETANQFVRGHQQKWNIRFGDESLVGQRLVTGVAVARAGSAWQSTLSVSDPSPEPGVSYYEIETRNPSLIIDSLKRVVVTQGLISAGAYKIAQHLSLLQAEEGEGGAFNEPPAAPFTAFDNSWSGQVYELSFPIPIRLANGGSFDACRMRFGISEGFVHELRSQWGVGSRKDALEGRIFDLKLHTETESLKERDWTNSPSSRDNEPVARYAAIQDGEAFIADFELLET